jgi:alcohol dehydrogenase (NADP+)
MVYPDTFEGFMVNSHEQWSHFQKQEVCILSSLFSCLFSYTNKRLTFYLQFKPKPLAERDVEIAIEACGVCGSDVHTLTGGWGQAKLPVCVGHEVIGNVVAIGPETTTVNVGDRVGVGAQVWACLDCKICKSGNENYCPHQVGK